MLGATLYTLDARAPTGTAPLWEAATARPEITLPAMLPTFPMGTILELRAWDAPDVTIYSVASMSQLRIPVHTHDVVGRVSWIRRVY